MHGYTNSGHPTACAVALRNLDIIEDEGLVERAATMGERLFAGLQSLQDLPNVGNVRGLGLIAGVELVADKETKAPFDPALGIGPKLFRDLRERGLLVRMKGESILLAPPLVVTESEVDHIVETIGAGIKAIMDV
jgi:adenosylmethionine-8-amino-7-oxononanoate aminotransferase